MDKNIEEMIMGGASNEDVEKYLAKMEANLATPVQVPKTLLIDVPETIVTPETAKKTYIPLGDLSAWLTHYNFATSGDHEVFADGLVKKFNIPIEFLVKVMKKLAKEGIINNEGKVDPDELNKKLESLKDKSWEFSENSDEPKIVDGAISNEPIPESVPALPDTITSEQEPLKNTLIAGDLIEFILNRVSLGNSKLTVKDLQDEFKISPKNADSVINDLKGGDLLKEDQLADIDKLKTFFKTLDYTANVLPESEKVLEEVKTTEEKVAPEIIEEKIHPAPEDPELVVVNPPHLEADTVAATVSKAPETIATPAAKITKNPNALAASTKMAEFLFEKLKQTPKAYLYATVTAIALGLGAGYALKNKENSQTSGVTSSSAASTAPMSPDKSGASASVEKPTTQIESAPEITNKDYEKTKWWMETDPNLQLKIKTLVSSKSSEEYVVPFLNEIEILNTAGTIKPSERTKSELYRKVSPYPDFLNITYSNTGIIIPECVISSQDEKTKELKNCYLRNNIAEIALVFRDIRSLVLGEGRYDPFPPKQTLPDSYKWMRDKIIAEINAKTAQK